MADVSAGVGAAISGIAPALRGVARSVRRGGAVLVVAFAVACGGGDGGGGTPDGGRSRRDAAQAGHGGTGSDAGSVDDAGAHDAGRPAADGGGDDDADMPDDGTAPFTWPPSELLEPSMDALEAMPCRIYYDERSDGSDDRSWGFDYDAEDRLVRMIDSDIPGLGIVEPEVTFFEPGGSPYARCRTWQCQRIEPRAEGDGFDIATHANPPNPRTTAAEPSYSVRYDGAGELASVHASTPGSVPPDPERPNVAHLEFVDGVPVSYSINYPDDEETESLFYPDGSLAMRETLWDPGRSAVACREDGWETSNDYCPDDTGCVYWMTEYQAAADGKPTSSHTSLMRTCSGSEDGDNHAYGSAWIWNASGGAVDLQASDDAGAWQQTFTVVTGGGETARDHDEQGNLQVVHVDEDGDGVADVAHTYRYEGLGPCREGTNPQLTPRIPDDPERLVPHACRFEPRTDAIAEAYAGVIGVDSLECL